MPLYLIERDFAEELDLDDETKRLIDAYNLEHELTWLTSFLSADKKKTYCLYEAPSADHIREAALRANVPADVIIEVGDLTPEMFA